MTVQVDFHFPNVRFVNKDGRLSNEAFTFLRQMFERSGGNNDSIAENSMAFDSITNPSSSIEIEESEKRLEEMQSSIYQLSALITELQQKIKDIESEIEIWPVS